MKSGFVNIVGNPNVGKSTLMNLFVGERISIATFKAQTTRHRILGIVNKPDAQIIFSDTPGVLKPNYKMQKAMLTFSESALTDADILLYVTDVIEDQEKNKEFLEKVAVANVPVLVLINKIDLSSQKEVEQLIKQWQERLPKAEIIREKILLYYAKEIPYSVEVVVELFKEDAKKIHINAVIYVERESQKGIIIGHKGIALKKVSTEARKALERFFNKSIYLEVFVKVNKDWRNNERALEGFGYKLKD